MQDSYVKIQHNNKDKDEICNKIRIIRLLTKFQISPTNDLKHARCLFYVDMPDKYVNMKLINTEAYQGYTCCIKTYTLSYSLSSYQHLKCYDFLLIDIFFYCIEVFQFIKSTFLYFISFIAVKFIDLKKYEIKNVDLKSR